MDYESEITANNTDQPSDTSSYNNEDSGDFDAFDNKSISGERKSLWFCLVWYI